MGESEKAVTADGTDSAAEGEKQGRRGGIDWSDPKVPVGNAPPMARWPLAVAGVAWLAGIVFLVAMTISRFRTDAL